MKTCYVIDVDNNVKHLNEYISTYGNLKLLKSFSNSFDALSYIIKYPLVDFIFLDVEIGLANGIEITRQIREKTKNLIFMIGSPKHLIGMFEVEANAYLLKPFSFEKLEETVNKLLLQGNLFTKNNQKEFLFIKNKKHFQYLKVYLNDIISIEAMAHSVKITTLNGNILSNVGFNIMKSRVGHNPIFVQVHKSFLICTNHIKSVEQSKVIMIDETTIPLGKKHKPAFYKLVKFRVL